MQVVRVGGVAAGRRGLRSAVDMVMYGATVGVKGAYGEANVKKTDEWERAGDTFEFTAATLRAIPQRRPYFIGRLLKEDLRFLIPYMLYPEKFDKPVYQPETLINLRVRGEVDDTGMGPVVYLWAEAGPPLVVGGMFFFGLAYGWIYYVCMSRLERGWTAVLYCLFLLPMMDLEQDWVQNLLQPVRMCMVWAAIWWAARLVVPAVAGAERRPIRRLADVQE